VGGHAATFHHPEGFVFDDGPHISFTADRRIQGLLAANVNHEFETFRAAVNNYWRGYWIRHPAQCHLYGLPVDLVTRVLLDLAEAAGREAQPAGSYEDWLIAAYGRTFADTFPKQYGLKYHTTPASNMTTDWLGPRMYRPTLEEALRGALAPPEGSVHYVSEFRYPSKNGFASYVAPFFAGAALDLRRAVARIDPASRVLEFADGSTAAYDGLVSSMPLPELIPRIAGVPADVTRAAAELACTTCVVVNVGVGREDISPAHWSYFYDQDVSFTRLSFPHMFSPGNAPAGAGSIQAELYYSAKYRPLDRTPEACIELVLGDLRRCGLLRADDRILMARASLVEYANVIFDQARPAALALVRGFLAESGIETCGRYGEWGYHWTDESFLSGEAAASRVLDRLPGTPRQRPIVQESAPR
jgi:protoporphyrinogen oxidase